jgi:hypothetical protein
MYGWFLNFVIGYVYFFRKCNGDCVFCSCIAIMNFELVFVCAFKSLMCLLSVGSNRSREKEFQMVNLIVLI